MLRGHESFRQVHRRAGTRKAAVFAFRRETRVYPMDDIYVS